MLSDYEDIFALAQKCGEVPCWFDENGVPRFCAHHPRHCADIYATEVALLLISCQRCGFEMRGQVSYGPGSLTVSLATRVEEGSIHYGDPPTHDDHGEYCHAGCTMNCWDLRVIEFWRMKWNGPRFSWERASELEVELPDLRDPERIRYEDP